MSVLLCQKTFTALCLQIAYPLFKAQSKLLENYNLKCDENNTVTQSNLLNILSLG